MGEELAVTPTSERKLAAMRYYQRALRAILPPEERSLLFRAAYATARDQGETPNRAREIARAAVQATAIAESKRRSRRAGRRREPQ